MPPFEWCHWKHSQWQSIWAERSCLIWIYLSLAPTFKTAFIKTSQANRGDHLKGCHSKNQMNRNSSPLFKQQGHICFFFFFNSGYLGKKYGSCLCRTPHSGTTGYTWINYCTSIGRRQVKSWPRKLPFTPKSLLYLFSLKQICQS